MSRDSLIGIDTGYGLDDRMIVVQFPAGAGNFSLRHRVQIGSGAHQASYPVGTRGSFPVGKVTGAWSWPHHSPLSSAVVKECVELYLHSPQYDFMAWCSFKAHGQLYVYLYL
jgi:hypothetical protein